MRNDRAFPEKFDVRKGSAPRLDRGDSDVAIILWDRNEVDIKGRSP